MFNMLNTLMTVYFNSYIPTNLRYDIKKENAKKEQNYDRLEIRLGYQTY